MSDYDDIAEMFDDIPIDIDTDRIIENVDSGDFVNNSNDVVAQIIARDPLDDLEEISDESPDLAMRPIDVRRMDEHHVEENTTETVVQNETVVELSRYQTQLDEVTAYILSACKSDREEAQEVIDDLRRRLNNISGETGPPPKALVEGIVNAVSVKSSINSNAIRIMETNTKFLAATKSRLMHKTTSTSSEELTRLLSGQ